MSELKKPENQAKLAHMKLDAIKARLGSVSEGAVQSYPLKFRKIIFQDMPYLIETIEGISKNKVLLAILEGLSKDDE
jgi:hypothetical protein